MFLGDRSFNSLQPTVRFRALVYMLMCVLLLLYIYEVFSYRSLDLEKNSIITGGLRRIAGTCRESVSSCAALAASGTIMRILNGFKNVFINNDPRYRGISIHVKKNIYIFIKY